MTTKRRPIATISRMVSRVMVLGGLGVVAAANRMVLFNHFSSEQPPRWALVFEYYRGDI